MARSDAFHFACADPITLAVIEKICQQTQALHCPGLGGTEDGILHAAVFAAMYTSSEITVKA